MIVVESCESRGRGGSWSRFDAVQLVGVYDDEEQHVELEPSIDSITPRAGQLSWVKLTGAKSDCDGIGAEEFFNSN